MVTAQIERQSLHLAPGDEAADSAPALLTIPSTLPVDELLGLVGKPWQKWRSSSGVRDLTILADDYGESGLLPREYFTDLIADVNWRFWLRLAREFASRDEFHEWDEESIKPPKDISAYITDTLQQTDGAFSRLVDDGVADLFLRALEAARKGELDPELAPYLKRVRFLEPGAVEVPDWFALAAWIVLWLTERKGDWSVVSCAYCERPFVQLGRAKYCRRRVVGMTGTCLEIGKARDYRANQKKRREN